MRNVTSSMSKVLIINGLVRLGLLFGTLYILDMFGLLDVFRGVVNKF